MHDAPLLKPRAVHPGGRVAIIAPASPFPRDEFESGVAEVRGMGFEPVVDPGIFDRRRYVAGDPISRARALMAAWQDPGIAAILTARGGYGSVELLPYLSIGTMRQSPKLLVGYSDVTALLSFLTTRCRVTAVHGPTVTGRLEGGPAAYDRATFLGALTTASPLGALPAPGLDVILPGEADGPVLGGNLTQLAASMGTPYAFDPPDGCVLFLEDVNERPYRVDRLLTQLRQCGVLQRARALVFGEFPGCDEPDGTITAREVVADAVCDFAGPVLWGLPSGHTLGAAITLPLGVCVRVVSGPQPAMIVLESAVADECAGPDA
jgi:muramoyltetrapeptide carboxypeptidase